MRKRLGSVTSKILDLETTLLCGQTFTFKHFKPSNSFVGVFGNNVVELTSNHHENDNFIYYRKLNPIIKSNDETNACSSDDEKELEQLISDYFQIDKYDIEELHAHFAKVDPDLFGKIVKYYCGWRLLSMEPVETLFSFICSSNNNVSRITKMVQVLCEEYGECLGEFTIDDGVTKFPMYKFPTLEQLEECTEKELKKHNFGYRAKYIVQTVEKLKKKPEKYLHSLRDKEKYATSLDVLNELKQFSGVGMKVASCVALYCMDRHDCVPTDVHILRIARNCYPSMKAIISKKKKSFTEKEIQKVMKEFVNIFGEYAGLAQMILYGSQLSQFKTRIPADVRDTLIKKDEESEEEDEESNNESSSAEEEEEKEEPIVQEKKKRRVVRRNK